MQHVAVDDVGSTLDDIDVRPLSDSLATTDLALNQYRLGPGDSLPAGLHAHVDQDEVFAVLDGQLEFETLVPPSTGATEPSVSLEEYEAREVEVAAGEVIRFAPGDFQAGRNAIEGETVVLAIGAPKESDDIRLPVACPTCGCMPIRLDTGKSDLGFECLECGDRHVPAPCPECGSDDLRVRLGDDSVTVVECQACAATFDSPPTRA